MVLLRKKWLLALVIVGASQTATAQQRMNLQEAASRAVLRHPDVQARLHTLEATSYERNVAFGGYLPTLDLAANVGRNRLDDPLATTASRYTERNVSVVLRQLLFDGFATSSDVRRLDHAKRVRYLELLDTSETLALEAVRAYEDVLRYRKLVDYASETYAQHKIVSDQISERTKKGVSRGVDLETASGRLALAESNVITETSNLFDVSARFQRIVGEKPAELDENPKALTAGLPPTPVNALQRALQNSPGLLASMENIQAAQADVEARRAGNYPRVELRLQRDSGQDVQGSLGKTDRSTAEVFARFNIFNGFRDQSRVNQYTQLMNAAKDTRDKTCRDLRQTVLIAMNDVTRLREQLAYLDQHQLSTDRARQAFRNQFDLGQRTLLDLLDTENEYFQARRAYVNAEHDLNIAYARVHAADGELLSALGIKPAESEVPKQLEPLTADDLLARCPAEGPEVVTVDKKKVLDDALRVRPARPATPTGAPPAKPGAPAPR